MVQLKSTTVMINIYYIQNCQSKKLINILLLFTEIYLA